MPTENPELSKAYEMICRAAEIVERYAITPIVTSKPSDLFRECSIRSRAFDDVWKAARNVRELYDPMDARSSHHLDAKPIPRAPEVPADGSEQAG